MAKHFRDMYDELENDVVAMFHASDFGAWYEDHGEFPKFEDALDTFDALGYGQYLDEDTEMMIAKYYVRTLGDYVPMYGNAALDALNRFTNEYRI